MHNNCEELSDTDTATDSLSGNSDYFHELEYHCNNQFCWATSGHWHSICSIELTLELLFQYIRMTRGYWPWQLQDTNATDMTPHNDQCIQPGWWPMRRRLAAWLAVCWDGRDASPSWWQVRNGSRTTIEKCCEVSIRSYQARWVTERVIWKTNKRVGTQSGSASPNGGCNGINDWTAWGMWK